MSELQEHSVGLPSQLGEEQHLHAVPDTSSYVFKVSMNTPTGQIKSVVALATDVFGDEQTAEEWLREPNLATDERPPLALLGTESGFSRVTTLLQRIDHGLLA